MRSIGLLALVPTDDTGLVFKHITDFPRYPSISPDVRSVAILPGERAPQSGSAGGARGWRSPRATITQRSSWEVNFRRGLMRWVEQEEIDARRLHVAFRQIDGDFDDFHGSWQLARTGAGCEVRFEVTYDFGIESLAGIMDPLAERVIKRAICAVLAGIVGEVTILEGGSALTDLDQPSPTSGIHIRTEGNRKKGT